MIALCRLAKLLPTHKTDKRYPSPKKASNKGCFAHAKLEFYKKLPINLESIVYLPL